MKKFFKESLWYFGVGALFLSVLSVFSAFWLSYSFSFVELDQIIDSLFLIKAAAFHSAIFFLNFFICFVFLLVLFLAVIIIYPILAS